MTKKSQDPTDPATQTLDILPQPTQSPDNLPQADNEPPTHWQQYF